MAGAGPAGCTAAKVLAEGGLSVCLVERHGPPREKTCGGLLSASSMDIIRRIYGSEPPSEVRQEPRELNLFVVPPSGFDNGFCVPNERVVQVSRKRFDFWLATSAEEKGVTLLRDTDVAGHTLDGEYPRVSLNTRDGKRSLTTNHLIAADGVYSRIGDAVSPRTIAQRAMFVQEYHLRSGEFGDCFHLIYNGGVSPTYAYVIPKGRNLCLGVGVLAGRPLDANRGLRNLRLWLNRERGFEGGEPIGREGFGVPFGGIRLGNGHIFLVGDAAGFCHPLTGEGISYAIASGEAAARAILEAGQDSMTAYEKAMAPLAKELEVAAAGTLGMSDEDRERRVGARRARAMNPSSRSVPGRAESP